MLVIYELVNVQCTYVLQAEKLLVRNLVYKIISTQHLRSMSWSLPSYRAGCSFLTCGVGRSCNVVDIAAG